MMISQYVCYPPGAEAAVLFRIGALLESRRADVCQAVWAWLSADTHLYPDVDGAFPSIKGGVLPDTITALPPEEQVALGVELALLAVCVLVSAAEHARTDTTLGAYRFLERRAELQRDLEKAGLATTQPIRSRVSPAYVYRPSPSVHTDDTFIHRRVPFQNVRRLDFFPVRQEDPPSSWLTWDLVLRCGTADLTITGTLYAFAVLATQLSEILTTGSLGLHTDKYVPARELLLVWPTTDADGALYRPHTGENREETVMRAIGHAHLRAIPLRKVGA